MQLAGSGGPEPFSRVVEIPDVQVAHLRSFGCGQPHKRFGRYFHGISAARFTQVGFHQCLWGVGDLGVEVLIGVDLGTLLGEIRGARLNVVAAGGVGVRVLATESEIGHFRWNFWVKGAWRREVVGLK